MEFRLLGAVQAWTDAGPVELGPARQQTVLAALLVDANSPVTVEQLVDRVWGERPPPRATHTLYSYVSRLRRLLPETINRGPGGGYVLTADASRIDVHRFRRLLGQAGEAEDEARAVALFQEALALWRAEPFAGADTPWFNAVRETLRKERWAAELDCTDRRLRLGQHAELLSALAERSTLHRLDERLAAQYMLALYRCGRQADALAHYRSVRGVLAGELGIDPGQDLRRLHQDILDGGAELGTPAARAAVTPPPAWVVQSQLPPAPPDFAGRDDLVDHLAELLASPAAVPVVVSGSPGVGKSALAVHLGHRLRPVFPDGQWYVRLLGTTERPRDPAEVLSGLLRACGLDADAVPETLDDRAAAFRSRVADRRVLLILDDAAGAEQVRPLLPGTAGVSVLVTSRPDLRGLTASHGAHPVPLAVLEQAEAHDLLAGVLGEQRVAAEPQAAARLAELCARLPLALRIAAANLAARPGTSLAAYAQELTEGSRRLTRLSIAGDRQAAVRTAFEHSHAALAKGTARLFALLGLHPGPDFTAEAAGALAGVPESEAEHLLDELATAGLVQRTATDRFQFHDLLRLYAQELAEADPDRETAWERLCAWYLATADAATAFGYVGSVQLPRPRRESARFADRHQALAWLEGERAHLVAVITRAAESGPYPTAWQLADQLRPYFYRRRHLAEWEAAMTAGLRAAQGQGEVLAQAAMHHGFFLMRQHAGRVQDALVSVHLALDGYRSAGFTIGVGTILTNLALHYGQRGQMRHALGWQEQSIAIARSHGGAISLGRGLNTAGLIHAYLGEFDRAVELTTEAIEACLEGGHESLTISPRINRALALHALGRYEEALADGTEALRLCEDHQQRPSVAGAHEVLARIHRDCGRTDLAGTHAELALQRARETADAANEADCLITLADLHRLNGRLDTATSDLREALHITRRCDFRHQQAEAHIGLAHVHRDLGDAPLATDHAELALAIARELELLPTERRALAVLGAVGWVAGDVQERARR
ncbi:tetratricopeptide repeat protein [Streptomyces sp. YC504]|uniref:Tetratricopeptide repeat protein n=1 Tax=Streptomyces mesophilus TaxID=1775132 RepID=A0A6G4XFA3_9ACTN|nr:BTAD domain-containing putative transcriptional regulator [Streptomyces mesophilus]NGO76219.1 tetratricopeptide repeat protein [Streptomyces mesophilus]